MTSTDGLWWFLACTLLRSFGLLVDFGLASCGFTTITEFARRNEWAALLILIVESSSIIALAVHFFGPAPKGPA